MLCSANSIVSCLTIIVLHTKQWLPSVKPVLVQEASTAESITTVCSFLLTISCATKTALQTEQWLPSVFPDS